MPAATPAHVNRHASTADFEFAALREARNYRRALLREFRPFLRGNVIEVGAGIGQFTQELQSVREITRLAAVEPDRRFHPHLEQVIDPTHIVRGLASNVDGTVPWNAIVSVNVLEHIEHEDAELRVYHELLRRASGHLCLFVPARPELYAQIDEDFGHFRRYTRRALAHCLSAAHFEVTALHYFNSAGYFAWWLNFRAFRRRGFNSLAVRLYDRCIFPAANWMERRIARPPLGQSLLAIARPS